MSFIKTVNADTESRIINCQIPLFCKRDCFREMVYRLFYFYCVLSLYLLLLDRIMIYKEWSTKKIALVADDV